MSNEQQILLENLNVLYIKDNTKERQDLVDAFLKKNILYFCLYRFLEKNIHLNIIKLFIFFASYTYTHFHFKKFSKKIESRQKYIFIYKNKNEATVCKNFSKDVAVLHMDFSLKDIMVNFFMAIMTCRQLLKIFNVYFQNNLQPVYTQLYCYLRACELLHFYFSYKPLFKNNPLQTILISTDGNPHGLAAIAAAQVLQKEVVFMAHAHFPLSGAPIKANKAILFGTTALKIYKKYGASFDNVFYYHQDFPQFRSKNKNSNILILLAPSKSFCWSDLDFILKNMNHCTFFVRYHPHTINLKYCLSTQPQIVKNTISMTIDELALFVDAVWAANSNVHLDFISRGTPSFFVSELDNTEASKLPFIKSDFLPNWSPQTSAHDQIECFVKKCESEDWKTLFNNYINTTNKDIYSLPFIFENRI